MKFWKIYMVVSFLLTVGVAQAKDSDGMLRAYLSKSELVVVGEIVDEPLGVIKETGFINYSFKFKVFDVLKGGIEFKGQTMNINVMQFEENRNLSINKGKKMVLFLKQVWMPTVDSYWSGTADSSFGIQYPDPSLIGSLKRLNALIDDERVSKYPLQLIIKSDKQMYTVGEPIEFTYTLKNNSGETQKMLTCNGFDLSWSNRFAVIDSEGNYADFMGVYKDCLPRTEVVIQPNNFIENSFRLDLLYSLKKNGTYFIQGQNYSSPHVYSNIITIEVVDKK